MVASVCTFDQKNAKVKKLLPYLFDSKKLNPKKREQARNLIEALVQSGHVFYGTGIVASEIIDTIGIKKANKYAMELALQELFTKIAPEKIKKIQVDGNDNYIFE